MRLARDYPLGMRLGSLIHGPNHCVHCMYGTDSNPHWGGFGFGLETVICKLFINIVAMVLSR